MSQIQTLLQSPRRFLTDKFHKIFILIEEIVFHGANNIDELVKSCFYKAILGCFIIVVMINKKGREGTLNSHIDSDNNKNGIHMLYKQFRFK